MLSKSILVVIILSLCSISYAEPLTVIYRGDTIVLDTPIIDSICQDNQLRNIAKEAVDAVNQKDYKKLIILGTRAVKICVQKLGGE